MSEYYKEKHNPNRKKIILITGVSGVGKDTFAEELKKQLESKGKKVLILHNATPVIEFAKKYFDVDDYKNSIGKETIMQLTKLFYLKDPFYFEKELDKKIDYLENINKEKYEYIIIPDWRYKATYQHFHTYSYIRYQDLYSVMLTREIKQNTYEMSEESCFKERKLLQELGDYIQMKMNIESLDDLEQSVEDFIVCTLT